jgi:excisionase family DNA binding protein
MGDLKEKGVMLVVSANEWNEQRELIRQIAENVKSFSENQSEYLTPNEVCEMLKIGRNTYERYWRNGILTRYKVKGTKRNYVRRLEVEKLLESGKL